MPLKRWLAEHWRSEAPPGAAPRAGSHPPAELAVADAVPDAMAFVVESRPLAAGEALAVSPRGRAAPIRGTR